MPSSVETDGYLKKFVDFLQTQPLAQELSYDDVAQASTREELGIGSLSIIMMISNYIKENASGVMIKPEWVSRLNDVDGILSVLREIDQSAS
jgi:hypothetical protein